MIQFMLNKIKSKCNVMLPVTFHHPNFFFFFFALNILFKVLYMSICIIMNCILTFQKNAFSVYAFTVRACMLMNFTLKVTNKH